MDAVRNIVAGSEEGFVNTEVALCELTEMQLVFVAGGIADPILA
jgi:hypothetical protein